MGNHAVELVNINKRFGDNIVLDDINLYIRDKEFLTLLGPSGCGKTTTLRLIGGFETPTSGKILFEGKDISNVPPYERNINTVFQKYALFPNMTVYENIEYGLKKKIKDKSLRAKKIEEVLRLVNLEHISSKYPDEMSGGQQQRVSLARAIALEPNILLLDEPLSALDAKVRENLRKEIKDIQRKLGITTIMVTHDQEEALTMADRIAVMNGGEIVQFGTPKEIYSSPKDIFVADFIGKINFITNKEEVFAIRPEMIEFSLEKEDKSFVGKIKSIEFRGAFYRIGVEVLDEILYIDIISQKWEKLNLKLEDNFYIKLDNGINL